MTVSGNATVKAVLSGDALVLVGRSTGGPPPEMQLYLAGLIAPKIARGPATIEEPFAFESREFLRNLTIGKLVSFKVDYTFASRNYGTVLLDGESVNAAVAREGWAKIKYGDSQREKESNDAEELKALSNMAEASRKGIFSGAGSVRNVSWTDVDNRKIYSELKGKKVRVLIEHVRDGSTMRCLILKDMTMITFSLAGVTCPRINAPKFTGLPLSNDGATAEVTATMENIALSKNEQPEPFAAEAKHFVEMRLLNREVDIVIEGSDKYQNLFGTVIHQKGNISIELLKNGLGKMADWSSVYLSRETAIAMRAVENEAKHAQLRLWKGWTPPQIMGSVEFDAVVVEVNSGDQVTVLDKSTSSRRVERRVALASVKAPRIGNPRKNIADEAWALEAKDYLRSMIIGETVKVFVEYEREIPQGETAIQRQFVTVICTKNQKAQDVSEVLLKEGLLTVLTHRADEPRSRNYEILVGAEQEGKSSKKRMHSGKLPVPNRISDITLDSKKAKSYFPHLKRAGPSLRGLVEYVFSGSRFKILVASENVSFMMALSSVRCPKLGRDGKPGEPGADEARTYSIDNLMQRNVEVDVQDIDRNGVVLGALFIETNSTKHDYAIDLLKAGHAHCDERAVERLGAAGRQLIAAENSAKDLKIGLHALELAANENDLINEEKEFDLVRTDLTVARLSDMTDGGNFCLHIDCQRQMDQVEAKMSALKSQVGTAGASMDHKRGSSCAALFNANDGRGECWYRAQIEDIDKKQQGFVLVRYIDHGNSSRIHVSKIRPLDRSYFELPPLAKDCTLAFTRVPKLTEDLGSDAANILQEMAWGKDLQVCSYGRDVESGKLSVALYSDDGKCINEAMIAEGCARITRRAEDTAKRIDLKAKKTNATEFVSKLKEVQQVAYKSRLGMWIYGDCTSDDDA